MNYEYSVIEKGKNDKEFDVDPGLWVRHPDVNFMIRTNQRMKNKPSIWITGVGKTKEDAIANAEFALRYFLFPESSVHIDKFGSTIVGPQKIEFVGTESLTPIKNK